MLGQLLPLISDAERRTWTVAASWLLVGTAILLTLIHEGRIYYHRRRAHIRRRRRTRR